MLTKHDLVRWHLPDVHCHEGGRQTMSAERAPFGRMLAYRRRAGEKPPPGCAPLVHSRGWMADLGQHGLADLLLGLATVTALREVTPGVPLHYSGQQDRLMRRCSVPLESSAHTWGPHVLRTATRSPVRFRVDSAEPPTWLDLLDGHQVEVHSALPMRHYLATEQALGVRLDLDQAPAPCFPSSARAVPWHVVFVLMSGWPRRLDLELADFAALATGFLRARRAPWRFTLITPRNVVPTAALDGLPVDVLSEPDAAECVDIFAAAELVIGTDVGLTQLAALTRRTDGTSPAVVGLYSRHSHTKWITGSTHHHAVATRFAQLLALTDRSAEPGELADPDWAAAADPRMIPPELVVRFAARCAGWW